MTKIFFKGSGTRNNSILESLDLEEVSSTKSNSLNSRNYLEAVRLFPIVCSCDLYNVITPKNKGIRSRFLVDLILADEKL